MARTVKTNENLRFPESAQLFRFCSQILQIKSGKQKIYDQEVGEILKYNPSDSSHWKKGKKSVSSIYALDALSLHLGVPLTIIQGISRGTLTLDEALFDYNEFEEHRKLIESGVSLQELYTTRGKALEKIAQTFLKASQIEASPIYLPEVLSAFPFIQMQASDISDKIARAIRVKPGTYTIKYKKGDLRPHIRVAIAREFARILLSFEREKFDLPEKNDAVLFYEITFLSSAFLIPLDFMRNELRNQSTAADVISSLSETFWVNPFTTQLRMEHLLRESIEGSQIGSLDSKKSVESTTSLHS